MFVHAKLRVHKTVMMGTNLHCLIYNLLIAIVFSLHLLLSVLVALTEYQTSGLKIDQVAITKIIRDMHSRI